MGKAPSIPARPFSAAPGGRRPPKPEAARAIHRGIEGESAWTGPSDSLPLSIGPHGAPAPRRAIVPVIHKERWEILERAAHSGIFAPILPVGGTSEPRRLAPWASVPAYGGLNMLKKRDNPGS